MRLFTDWEMDQASSSIVQRVCYLSLDLVVIHSLSGQILSTVITSELEVKKRSLRSNEICVAPVHVSVDLDSDIPFTIQVMLRCCDNVSVVCSTITSIAVIAAELDYVSQAKMRTCAQCPVCEKGPYLLNNLYRHMRRTHDCTEENIQETKLAVKRAVYATELKCDTCGKIFFSEGGLSGHKKTHTDGNLLPSTSKDDENKKVECPECRTKLHSIAELAEHCHIRHGSNGQDFTISEETISSWQEFEAWLLRKEKETISKLVKRHTRKSSRGNIYMFICSRAQGTREGEDAKEYKKRYVTSKKKQKYCPCHVKAQLRGDGLVKVTSCFGHLGHDVNAAYLPLSSEDIERIRSLLTVGLPFSSVVSKLRSEWNPDEEDSKQKRTCYITLRDVCNIASRCGLLEGRSCENDRTSYKALLAREEIFAHKLTETDKPTGDGFILAFITIQGKAYIEQYGHRGVICDDTFNVTKYAFRLATLLVTDDSGNGIPCAHLISYRMTSAEVQHMFEIVKQSVSEFDPEYFMSDDTYTFYNAFKAIFPHSHAKKVLCSFHVSQIFKRKHKEHLKAEFLPTAEKLIRSILFETDKVKFENGFASYMSWLVRIGATDMLNYVERNFSNRRREWAICYRERARFTTSNHAESFHNTFKHVILGGKQNNRLDTVIYALLKLQQNRHVQLLSLSARGGAASKRWKANIAKHKEALIAYKNNTSAIVQKGENTWEVKSANDNSFIVTIAEGCDCSNKLNSHCGRCGVCSYQVVCNCVEGYRSGVSCKHAHAVITFAEQAQTLIRLRSNNQARTLSSPIRGADSGEVDNCYNLAQEGHTANSVLEQDAAKTAYQLVEGAQAQVSEIARTLLKKNDADTLTSLYRNIRKALDQVPEELVGQHFIRRLPLQTVGAGPAPGRIQPFRTRNALKEQKKHPSAKNETEEWAKRVLETDRTHLLTCFVCGRRDPEEDEENDVLWLSCSNYSVCKAWAHMKCVKVGEICTICQKGSWRHEEI